MTPQSAFALGRLQVLRAEWIRELELVPPGEQLQREFVLANLRLIDEDMRELVDA